jgi:hypothetical protein
LEDHFGFDAMPVVTHNYPISALARIALVKKRAVVLFLLLIANSLWACSCDLGSARKKLKNFENVFVGTVKSIERSQYVSKGENERIIRVQFSVEQRWKGADSDDVLDTVENTNSCFGSQFDVGERAIVYAFKDAKGWNVLWCGGVVSEDEGQYFQRELRYLKSKKRQTPINAAEGAEATRMLEK